MDDTSQTSVPPWLSDGLPRGNWHADVDFLDRAYDDLEELADILHPNPLWTQPVPVIEDQCDCNSVDGGDQPNPSTRPTRRRKRQFLLGFRTISLEATADIDPPPGPALERFEPVV
ncbi:hypothetical protein FRC01_000974 [Tulasnella sp. 417]|nr:hypothetical protein FRC01_000974 [Tulasnella sp. 417]